VYGQQFHGSPKPQADCNICNYFKLGVGDPNFLIKTSWKIDLPSLSHLGWGLWQRNEFLQVADHTWE
jgi:hypothetical protein